MRRVRATQAVVQTTFPVVYVYKNTVDGVLKYCTNLEHDLLPGPELGPVHLRHARRCQRLGVDVLELFAHACSAPELVLRCVAFWVVAQKASVEE